jgi:hypothetical protein
MRTNTRWIPLVQIRIGERRLRGVNAATVELYRRWLEEGREAPPVTLIRHGEDFVVRDGRHRVTAALAAGFGHICARLTELMWSRITAAFARTVGRRTSRAARPALGTRLCRQSASLAPRRSGFDSRRLHPVRSMVGPQHVRRRGPAGVPGSCHAQKPQYAAGGRGFESLRLHSFASVVSTASTRPSYGRGAGSTPAGGFLTRP